MYGTLALRPKALEDYRPIIGEAAIDEIRRLAEPLQGLRVLHLSVTAFGTGVAELLNATVPLLSDVGLRCNWQVVRPAEEFAAANKAIYRALAGSGAEWSAKLSEIWLRYSAMNAELLTEPFDVIIVHDLQPAAIRSFVSEAARVNSRWVLQSHLDLSSAEPEVWALLRSHIEPYDAIVFETDAFIHPDLRTVPVTIIRPAINPLGPRNMELSSETMQTLLRRYGIDADRPLLCQISPCDPGSDFLGAIDVHDRVRRNVPGLQLALIAMHAPQDPASIAYFNETVLKSMEYSDVHILRGVSEVGNVEENAFQRAANVLIQKGLRRGFGIWVSDAQWKERPVVTARTGGLALQVQDGETGFLADNTEEFAERVTQLFHDAKLARRLGQAGHQHVADNFLITRFVADELRLLADLTQEGR
jgi:trehalose synthase